MSAHAPHHGPPDAVLADACPRCNEWADDPAALSDEALQRLLERVDADDRTNAEHRALALIGRARFLAQRVDGGRMSEFTPGPWEES